MFGWSRPLNELTHAELEQIAKALKNWEIMPSGTLGYAKAEVTLGGVDTRAVIPNHGKPSRCRGCSLSARWLM